MFGMFAPSPEVLRGVELDDATALTIFRSEGLIRKKPRHRLSEREHPVREDAELVSMLFP